MILHFLEEWECYAVIHHMLRRRAWLDQSPQQIHASWTTFRALCNSHIVCRDTPLRPSSLDLVHCLPDFSDSEVHQIKYTRYLVSPCRRLRYMNSTRSVLMGYQRVAFLASSHGTGMSGRSIISPSGSRRG